MPRLPKVIINNTVIFVTFSVEEDFMFPPNPAINLILQSCLARAQALYPVTICHLIIESTHVHMILKVSDPNDIPSFVRAFKTESAHAVNRLLGRKKRTVWCEGFDSPILLTEEDAIEKIVYLYSNPSKDGLEESIEKYPGVSSWLAYQTDQTELSCPWIPRSRIPFFDKKPLSPDDTLALATGLRAENKKLITLTFEPDAWMKCFGIDDVNEQKSINLSIYKQLKTREQEYAEQRKKDEKTVLGTKNLISTPIGDSYRPRRRDGRKMWCICSDVEFRTEFICFLKSLVKEARRVYELWKQGGHTVAYPVGLFAPALPKRAELLYDPIFA